MTYSLWSRGRLIGRTDLGFVYRENGCRCGWFHPNELGEKLMPAATGISPAMRAAYEAGKDVLRDPDFLSACDYEHALEMRLHGPNGDVNETEMIGITDTHYLLSIPDPPMEDDWGEPLFTDERELFDPDDEEDDWSMDFESDLPWEEPVEHPRYQILIRLKDHDAIPY